MDLLTKYLKDVATLECQYLTQNRLMKQIKNESETLGIPARIPEPVLAPWKPSTGNAFLVSIPIAFLLSTLISNLLDPNGMLLFWWTAIKFFLPVYLVVFAFVSIIYIFRSYRLYSYNKKEYKEELIQYELAVKSDALRVEHELIKKNVLINQWQTVKAELDKTRNALVSIYGVGVIHKKYQNLVAIASFYDYLDTGRCFSLTGPGGAYAVYEEDLRFRRIETRLEIIINKLDEIISNQQYLGELMQDSNNTLHRIESINANMLNSTHRIDENVELAAYNSYCSTQCNAVINDIILYQALREKS